MNNQPSPVQSPQAAELIDTVRDRALTASRRGDHDLAIELSRAALEREARPLIRARLQSDIASFLSRLGRLDEAEEIVRSAVASTDGTGDRIEIASRIELANCLSSKGEREESVAVIHDAIERAERYGHEEELTLLLVNLASRLKAEGQFSEALEHIERALPIARRLGLTTSLIVGEYHLAELNSRVENFDAALRHANAALSLAEGSQYADWRGHTHNLMAIIHLERGDVDAAHVSSQQAVATLHACGCEQYTADAMNVLAEVQFRIGAIDQALETSRAALELLRSFAGEEILQVSPLMSQGHFLLAAGHPASAVAVLCEATELAERIGARDVAVAALWNLYQAYEACGQFESAYRCALRHHELQREIYSAAAAAKIHAMESKLRLRDAEEAATAERHRAERLQQHVERQRAELAAQAMHIARQTELLGKFRNELKAILREADRAESAITAIRERLDRLPCEAIDWTRFESEFRQSYPDFAENLVAKYPSLSRMELKVCSMLRLRLTTNDIATLFCVSERTIDTHRVNIRRKIGLAPKEDLGAFLEAV